MRYQTVITLYLLVVRNKAELHQLTSKRNKEQKENMSAVTDYEFFKGNFHVVNLKQFVALTDCSAAKRHSEMCQKTNPPRV